MRFFVLCDKQGNITSTMKVEVMDEALEHPYGNVEEQHLVLELMMPKAVADIDPHDISQLYRVDVKQKKLRKLPGAAADKSGKKAGKKRVKKPVKKTGRARK